MNSFVDNAFVNVHECEKCLKLETEFLNKKDFIEKEIYDKLFTTAITKGSWGFEHTKACFRDEIIPFVKALKDLFNTFDQYLIDELSEVQNVFHQMEQAVEQYRLEDNSVSNQSAPSFDQLFELNELKAQSQEKDTVIKKLKERIKSLSGKMNEDKIKKDLEEIETINIELDHREKVLEITTLKDDLRKLKGKALVDNVVTKHTIDLEMLKIDVEPITPKFLNKKIAHSAYIKHTQEEATVLRDLVEQRKVWKPTGKVFINIGYIWRPTGRTFTIVENVCPLTRITTATKVPLRKLTALENEPPKPVVTLVYSRKPKKSKTNVLVSKSKVLKSVVQIVLWYLDSGCSKQGVDLLTGSQGNNRYTLSLGDMMTSSPICLPKLKFEKNHLCSACALGKSKKKPHKPKSEDTNQEKLYLLHMDLCGPMRVASVNGKKYILVIVNDYSRFTWVKCLRSKDEAPDFIIKFLKMIQVRLKVPVRRIRTDNGTEFVNQTLREYYEKVGISHETSIARSPQQNGVVERRNRTLIEAARTMLIYAKALLFLWAEAVATACYTQNHSVIRLQHDKTPYELLHDKLPDLSFFYVFGALCYSINDSENLGKLQPKADIGIFIGYAPTKKAFRIYNRRTRRIIEIIHVDFDELTAMASEQSSLGPTLHEMTPIIISSGLVPNPPPSTPFIPPSRTDWYLLFQPLFDELLTPPPSVDCPAPKVIDLIAEVVAPEPAASTGSHSSTTVDQDAW
ncbi:retrovirus-related pol polyprotein from transposon TNT 1-94 [Tanacetum coccineum]